MSSGEHLVNIVSHGSPGGIPLLLAEYAEWDDDSGKWKFTLPPQDSSGASHVLYGADSVVDFLRDMSPDYFNG